MDNFAKSFLKSSLLWLTFGVTLGVAMAGLPAWTIYRPAHFHMLLLGFVNMMICGVAYHVVPRFVSTPLYSRRAPVWHWWMANIGLTLMAAGFVLRANAVGHATAVLASGGALAACGAYVFAYVLWRTIDSPAARAPRVVPLTRATRDELVRE